MISVKDVLDFESLPIETQELARRVLSEDTSKHFDKGYSKGYAAGVSAGIAQAYRSNI
jgi:hypothetical protein